MKPILMSFFLLSGAALCLAQTTSQRSESFSTTERTVNGAQASSTSATTTSDGKTTVKKTVTVIDGVRKVVIETTDENGKTTREEIGGNPTRGNTEPWIGVRVSEVPQILRDQLGLAEDEGLAVDMVAEGSPAMEAGIQKGDLLLKVGEVAVASKEDLSKSLSKHQVGEDVPVTAMRKAKRAEIKIKLANAPDEKEKTVPNGLREGIEKSTVESVDVDITGEGFEALLNNPDLPESFKKTIREMQKSLREFEKKKE